MLNACKILYYYSKSFKVFDWENTDWGWITEAEENNAASKGVSRYRARYNYVFGQNLSQMGF